MTNQESFSNDTYNKIRETILNFDNSKVPDIYAISFFKSNIDDDPRKPTLIIGYNTVSNWKQCTPGEDQEPDGSIASDSDEAKWNFAFWLQNEELVIGGNEYDPVSNWVKQLPSYFTDEQEKEDFDKTFEAGEEIQLAFIDIMISHSQRLHREGIIKTKFGKDIPIIIHELEYYDVPLNWTKQGNPAGLTKEFDDWVESM